MTKVFKEGLEGLVLKDINVSQTENRNGTELEQCKYLFHFYFVNLFKGMIFIFM